MNGKYTPGPWFFRPEEPRVEAEYPANEGFFCTVADCGKSRTLEPDAMAANAKLIAAAPDLLEVLKVIESRLDRWARGEFEAGPAGRDGGVVKQIRAAISKAGGAA